MIEADVAIITMYVLALAFTRHAEFVILLLTMNASFVVFWPIQHAFSIEYLYFLLQSFIWLIASISLRKSFKVAMAALTMCFYEWLVAIESFIWQFITPVETPLHSQYAFVVMGIHLFILYKTAKWGGEIGYFTWPDFNRSIARSNLSMLEVHNQRSKK